MDIRVADTRVGDIEVDLTLARLTNVDLQGMELGGGIVATVGDYGLRVKMCVWLGVSRGLDLAFLNAD